ncbi:LysR family transcriptional regulator [Oricola sp.]|uniref:LysR family transcriptional regulator n=1 Tax=Oricola sp. TaxID=1979950 RepID=UPI003BA8E019
MDTDRFNWNLVKSFLAVLDAGSLLEASTVTGVSQPTLGRHITELEHTTGLVLFARGRSGMAPTQNALALAEEARAMQTGAAAFAMTATGRDTRIEGTVRITASEVVSTYLLPPVLSTLLEAEPAIEIELVATNAVENLLARDADIALRMVRPVQNDLIARKLNQISMGAFAHRNYLDRHGAPASIAELQRHRMIGYDRTDLIERGMERLGLQFQRSIFRLRTDHQVAYWEMVKAGAGIGFGPLFVAAQSPDLIRVVPELDIEPLPCWLASHQELKHSPKVRRVFDFLANAISALPLSAAGDRGRER